MTSTDNAKRFQYHYVSGYYIDVLPDTCPFCEHGVKFSIIDIKADDITDTLQLILQCPRNECRKYTMGLYEFSEYILAGAADDPFQTEAYSLQSIAPENPVVLKTRSFSEEIASFSPSFIEIYNQAYQAEQCGLKHIAGVGYRKSLEFLIKDFLVTQNPSDKSKIMKTSLGRCIDEYIDDERVKEVARRATWLGNDETHYLRKWKSKDLRDLKQLIDLTAYWLSSNLLFQKYLDDMPK